MGMSVSEYLRSQRRPGGAASRPDEDEDLDTILERRGSSGLGPLIRSIHQQESSGGAVDTFLPGNGGARGPMQVIEPTFEQMKLEGRIPAEYRWDNPRHSTEAGIAYVESLAEKFGNDPRAIAQAYYGGPGAVGKEQRRDPRNPQAPTVGEYASQVVTRANGGAAPAAGVTAPASGGMSVSQYLKSQQPAQPTVAQPAQPTVAQPAQQAGPSMPWLAVTQHEAYVKSDDDQREAIRNRYFEDEIAPLVPADQREAARKAFDADTAPGIGRQVVDVGKSFAGGAVQGVGMMVSGLGELSQQGAEGVSDIVQRYGGKRLETVDPLKGVSKAIDDKAQQILDSRTTAAQALEIGSTPEGDLDKPETWSWGNDPTLGGYVQQGAKVLGQFAPMIMSTVLTRGRSLATQFKAGATMGGLQGGGAAADQARETLEPLTEAELTQQSETYRKLRETLPHEDARAKTIEEAEKWAFRLTLPISALGGAATAGILSPGTRIGTRLVGTSVPGNMAVRGVAGGLEEGLQETEEGIATEQGINVGAGMERDVMTASVPNFVLGTLGGAPTGAGAGGLAARAQKLRERAEGVRQGQPPPSGPTGEPIPAADVLGTPGEEKPGVRRPRAKPAAAGKPVAEQPGGPMPDRSDPQFEDKNALRQLKNSLAGPNSPRGVPWEKDPQTRASYERSVRELERQLSATPATESAVKKPWQKTRQEFADDAAYQGVNAVTDESSPSYWFTDQAEEARQFAEGGRGDGTAPARTEPRIDIASKQELGAEWKDSERPTKSKHAYTGESKKRPIVASVPLKAASDPHRFLVEQALANGETVPDAVLAEYPDLVKQGAAGRTPAVDAAAHEAATSPANDLPQPTDGQKEAGNYKKGHVRLQGLDISIENPKGSTRSGTGADGKPWSATMPAHYGYIRGTEGKDKDHIDVTLGEQPDDAALPVFVFNQSDRKGNFDEHKVFMGFADEAEARKTYRDSFSGDLGVKMERSLLGVREYTADEFKGWLDTGNHKRPAPSLADDRKTKPETIAAPRETQARFGVKEIGQNADGATIYEDRNGIRSVLEHGIRVGETVKMVPTRAGVKIERASRDDARFQPVDSAAGLMQRIKDEPELRETLERMAGETGWSEEGGHIIRKTEDFSSLDYNTVVGRTRWLPYADWWAQDRPAGTRADYEGAVRVALAGRKLGSKQLEIVRFMATTHDEMGRLERTDVAPQDFNGNFDHGAVDLVALAAEASEHAPDYDIERLLEHSDDFHVYDELTRLIAAGKRAQPDAAAGVGRMEAAQGADLLGADQDRQAALNKRNAELARRRGEGRASIPSEKAPPGDIFREQADAEGRAARAAQTDIEDVGAMALTAGVFKAQADWWDRSLTSAGRSDILKAAGVKLPATVRWQHMSPADRQAVDHMRPAEFRPEDRAKAQASTEVAGRLSVAFGGQTYAVASVEDAADKWDEFRDAAQQTGSGGVSEIGNGVEIRDQAGKVVARVAYNGRISRVESADPNEQWSISVPGGETVKKFTVPGAVEKDAGPVKRLDMAVEITEKANPGAAADLRNAARAMRSDGYATAEPHFAAAAEKLYRQHPHLADAVDSISEQFKAQLQEGAAAREALEATPEELAQRVEAEPELRASLKTLAEQAEAEDLAARAGQTDIEDVGATADDAGARWDAMEYGARQPLAEAAYPGMRKVVHRIAGSKWDELGPGEQGSVTKAMAEQPAAVDRVYGASNKVFTAVAAEAARARLKKKLGQLNTGLDPEMVQDGMLLAGYHIEAGARSFAAYSKAMVADLGEEVKPYLRAWYVALTMDPRAADLDGLTPVAEVMDAKIDEVLGEPEGAAAAEQSAGREIVEHVTKKGKRLRGTILTGVSREEAKAIDKYTFRKGAGFFIREEHFGKLPKAGKTAAPSSVEAPAATEGALPAADRKFVDAVKNRMPPAAVDPAPLASLRHARDLYQQVVGGDLSGAAIKRVDELVELAIVEKARWIVERGGSPAAVYASLVQLYGGQPNLSTRTSTSIEQQAYSTPAPLAFIASRLAGIGRRTTVYEPSAGNGMLLIEATPSRATVNELNEDRAESLRSQGFEVTTEDASVHVPDGEVDAVIANPPFGTVKGEGGVSRSFTVETRGSGSYQTTEIDHAIAFKALAAMKDNGRAVLLVGGINKQASTQEARSDAYSGLAKRRFYYHLYNNYRVTDHFTVSGDLYSRQGAAWPVDVIVIEGRGKSARELPAVDVPRVYNQWGALEPLLEQTSGEQARGVGTDREGPGSPGLGDTLSPGPAVSRGPVHGPAGRADSGARRQVRGPEGSDETTAPSPVGRGAVPGPRDRTAGPGGELAGVEPAGGGAAGGQLRRPAGPEFKGGRDAEGAGAAGRRAQRPGERAGQLGRPDVAPAVASEGQVPYAPQSSAEAIGTLVPSNMQTAVRDSLAALEARVGPLDDYVSEQLGYGKGRIGEFFAAEQVDALALALDQMARGRGFIIGDQTGVGKGRVVAGVIRFALKNGLTPIFVTAQPNLYGDMYRDLTDIGVRDIRPLMTNGSKKIQMGDNNEAVLSTQDLGRHNRTIANIAATGDLGEFNMVFTTYNQMQTVRGNETPRMAMLRALAPNAIVMFDESHNAGGQDASRRNKAQKDRDRGEAKTGRAAFARQIAGVASSVFYSSATYAKRPEVMDLYSTTDMALAVNGQVDKLAGAIMQGGVPLQQVVASMLARAGQYIRRERTFEGVVYDTPAVEVDRAAAERLSSIMLAVKDFDETKQGAIKDIKSELKREAGTIVADGATGQTGATSTNFTSIMHNVIDQMLLSLKVDHAADMAIAAIKRGEKPVITVANTMGSFIEHYVEDAGVKPGDAIALSFKELLERYLERSRIVHIKDVNGGRRDHRLSDGELGPAGVAAFKMAKELIDTADAVNSIPISPIDWLHHRLSKAGYSVGEITGRDHTIDYRDANRSRYRRRKSSEKSTLGRQKTIIGFNNGTLDAIILNQSGSTGLSLHASEKFKDQRRRHMIIAQAERNIDTHMQMLGRVHRTGQVIAPAYSQLVANVPAEKRPAAVLAKKMASLNANTTASRTSILTAKDTVDFLNEYGDEVVAQLMADMPEVHRKLGEPLESDEKDGLEKDEAARKVSGRIPLLPVEEQERLYELIETGYEEVVRQADALGQNKLEAKTLDLDARTLSTTTVFESRDTSGSPFADGAYLEQVDAKNLGKPFTSEQVRVLTAQKVKAADDADWDAIKDAGRRKWDQAKREVDADFDKFRSAAEARLYASDASDSVRLGKLNVLDGQADRWRDIAGRLEIGETYSLRLTGGAQLYGVLTDITRKEGVKLPVATGSWVAHFAVADGARSLAYPFSKLVTESFGLNEVTGNGAYITQAREDEDTGAPILDMFDAGQTVTREKRFIATGNLLAAFGTITRGQIANFTAADGSVRQGILMPKDFDLGEFAETQPVSLTPEQALEFIGQRSAAAVTTSDGLAAFGEYGYGRYRLSVPRAKAEGGKYFLDQEIRAVVGDFVSSGNTMSVTMDRPDARNVLTILERKAGPLITNQFREDARRVGGKGVGASSKSGPLYSRSGPAPGFYSAAIRAIEGVKQPKATGPQWMGILKNTPGVKQEELDWLGVQEWLASQEGAVSRESLLGYMRANEITIEEVLKTDEPTRLGLEFMARERAEDDGEDWNALTPDERELRIRDAADDVDLNDAEPEDGVARFRDLQLPGGENYRELLLTLPPPESTIARPEPLTELPAGYDPIIDDNQPADRRWGVTMPGQVSARPMGWRHPTKAAALAEALALVNNERLASWANERDKDLAARTYNSPHFPGEQNVIAHIRFNERTDADGKHTLFIEEIQSDWHQAGRKKGYFNPAELDVIEREIKPAREALLAALERDGNLGFDSAQEARAALMVSRGLSGRRDYAERWELSPDTAAAAEAYLSLADRKTELKVVSGVPDAPLKTTWPELALKRMVRWAAENGFDKVAWTTGEQQAQRYDLSKQVDAVTASRDSAGNFKLIARKGTGSIPLADNVPSEKVAEYVGKDLAEKITALRPGSGQTFAGLDLKVGGEGMSGFYDNILVRAANKIGKKFGGRVGKVVIQSGTTTFDVVKMGEMGEYWSVLSDNYTIASYETRQGAEEAASKLRERERAEVHALDLTPELKAAALAGQPLFRDRVGAEKGAGSTAVIGWLRGKIEKLGGAARVHVVKDVAALRRAVGDQGINEDTEGVYYEGTRDVYLVASKIPDRATAERLFRHEVNGHLAVEVYGDIGQAVSDVLAARKSKAIAALWAEVAKTQPGLDRKRHAKEVIALVAERGLKFPAVDRLVGRVRAMLRKLGIDLEYTEADLRAVVARAARAMSKDAIRRQGPAVAGPALASRSESGSALGFAAEVLRELGVVSATFRLRPSKPSDLFEAMAQVPGFDVPAYDTPETDNTGASRYVTHFTRTDKNGKTERVPVYIYQQDRKVWIDVSRLKRGEGGERIYQAIADYARTTKRRFVGDPTGLSKDAVVRRTYAMLSNMVRYGGDLGGFEPAAEQLNGKFASEGVPALRWPDDAEGRLRSLIEQFHATISHAHPRIAGASFDFGAGTFRDRAGRALSTGEIEQIAESGDRKIPGGGRALRAGIFVDSLLRLSGGERPGLLAHVLRQPAALVQRTGPLFARGGRRELDHTGLIDAALKHMGGKAFADLITSPIYDRLIRLGGAIVPEKLKQATISDFGLPEPYLDAKVDKTAAVNKVLRKTRNILDHLTGLTREQSRVAYLWMNEKPDTDLELRLLDALPEDSRAAVEQMKKLVDELGQEAVEVGLLTPDSYERNKMAYLHRSYRTHMQANDRLTVHAKTMKNAAVRADNFKGRGLRDDVSPEALGDFEVGDKRLRAELRGPRGGLQEVRYVPIAEGVPPGWVSDGEWEIRWLSQKPGVGPVAGMWRDLTPEERGRLGEIEEVRYAFARTMLNAIHDVENQRFLAWVADNYAVDEGDIDPAKLVEPGTGYLSVRTYAADEYVTVPNTGIKHTAGLKKFGRLAGKTIPAVMWNDIRNAMTLPESDFARYHERMMRWWKLSKTALSPTVHVNNVMSNFILSDISEVRARDVKRALAVIALKNAGSDEGVKAAALRLLGGMSKQDAENMIARYEDSGAEQGSFHAIELNRDIIKPLLDELNAVQDESLLGQLSMAQVVSLFRAGDVKTGGAALARKPGLKQVIAGGRAMIELYRSEDAVFRLAKFMREVESGKTDRAAGRAARDAFLNYDINAPLIQAARRTVLPFIAFSYRAIPKMIETAAHKPWKIAKYYMIGTALNALAYAALGLGGDAEDKERKLLPEELQGRLLGVFPRLVRLPWNDRGGAAVFLDVRRWVPAGDLFDTAASHSAVPLTTWLSVGGPLSFALEMYANKNMFTGEPLYKETDTGGEKVAKIADYLFRFAMPNLPLPNPANFVLPAGKKGEEPRFIDLGITPGVDRDQMQTYAWTNILRAGTGRQDAFGRESGSVGQALASSFGVKARSYPADVARKRVMTEYTMADREIDQNLSQLAREYARGGLSRAEYDKRVAREVAKKQYQQRKVVETLGVMGE